MKKIVRFLLIIIVLMLINDAVQLEIAARKRRRELNRQAVRRLRLNRKKKLRRTKLKARILDK